MLRLEWKGRWARWKRRMSPEEAPTLPGVVLASTTSVMLPRRVRRARRFADITAQQVLLELRHRALNSSEIESRAEKLITQTDQAHVRFPIAELLALKLNYFVIIRPDLEGCGHENLVPMTLLVRASVCEARLNLRLFHEIAHADLRASGTHFEHGDVWALTLALAIPRRSVRHLSVADHIPAWARNLRRLTSRVVPR